MEFSRRERLARVGAPRARRVGVGERGTTLPAPLGSAEGETAPRASSQAPALPSLPPSKRVVALTVAGGWRAGVAGLRALCSPARLSEG